MIKRKNVCTCRDTDIQVDELNAKEIWVTTSWKYDKYAKRTLRGRRTNNLNQNSYSAKGDKYQKLACIQFEWEDLNEKNDNYNSPIDCYDPKTGLFHQVRGRISYYGTWTLTRLEYEWNKKFETMVIYCANRNGKYIERIYIFPWKEIVNRDKITIYKNPTDAREIRSYHGMKNIVETTKN